MTHTHNQHSFLIFLCVYLGECGFPSQLLYTNECVVLNFASMFQIFVFAAFIEYAIVNVLARKATIRKKKQAAEEAKKKENNMTNGIDHNNVRHIRLVYLVKFIEHSYITHNSNNHMDTSSYGLEFSSNCWSQVVQSDFCPMPCAIFNVS